MYSQHISHAAAGDFHSNSGERTMNEPLPDTSINSMGGGGPWKTQQNPPTTPFGGGIWSSNSGSSLNNVSWLKETAQVADNQNWMHGGGQSGTGPMSGNEDMQMRWGKAEVNQQTPWNMEQGVAPSNPSSGTFDTQWPLSGRKPQSMASIATGQRRFENGRREEGGAADQFFHQQMLYGDDTSFYNNMNGNGFQPSALSPHHPSQSWAMQNSGADFMGSQQQQPPQHPTPYGGNGWMQQCQQTPPPLIHGDVGSSSSTRIMPVSTQIPPPSMGGAQKYINHAQAFAPQQQFASLAVGDDGRVAGNGPTPFQGANNAQQQFNPSYASQQQNQQQQHQPTMPTLFTNSEDPVWRDPNSALRRWQEQTGTTLWDKPGTQSKPIRLWKEHSDDGPYMEKITSREQPLQPQQCTNGENGWGELPTIDEEKFKHHHVLFDSSHGNSSSAYGPPSVASRGGGGGYHHPNPHNPGHAHPHQHQSQQFHAESYQQGGVGRQYHHPPSEGHFTPSYHIEGGAMTAMRHRMSVRPDSVAPHQKWTAQAPPPPLYPPMDRVSAERMPLFDPSGMMGAGALPQISLQQHHSGAPFKQRQMGGPVMYPRDEGAVTMWGSDMLQSTMHQPQMAGHFGNRGMGAEPVKVVRNLVEELSFIPVAPSDVDRGELGPVWAGLPTQHSTLMNPSASSVDSHPPIMP